MPLPVVSQKLLGSFQFLTLQRAIRAVEIVAGVMPNPPEQQMGIFDILHQDVQHCLKQRIRPEDINVDIEMGFQMFTDQPLPDKGQACQIQNFAYS